MEEFVLVRFSKKTGKIDTLQEGISAAMLKLWALQNTKKTKDTIIFSKETGDVICWVRGTSDFPNVREGSLGNIEDLSGGLLEYVRNN